MSDSIPPNLDPTTASPAAIADPMANPVAQATDIELPPNFVLPTGLSALAIPLLGWSLWAGLLLAIFAAFLTLQAATLRLRFTATDLDIYRGDALIRRFPYSEWENWDIFWYYLPTLFYFKEVKSIHFLPILFPPTLLRACLEAKNLPTRRSWQ